MKKLDFVFVGPYRTGTTWLYEYFKRHPEVSVPTKVKETFFFDMKYAKGFKWYFSHFKDNEKHKKRGEIAPSYFRSTEAAERLFKFNSDMKVFFTLRDPVDRLISHYRHALIRGNINQKTSIIKAYENYEFLNYAAQYTDFIGKWKKIFPKNNVYILKFKNFRKNNQKYVDRICSHLNINSFKVPENLKQKVGQSIPVKYHLISSIAYKTIKLLRKFRLHFIINFLKAVNIRNFLTAKTEKITISNRTKKKLQKKLKDQITYYNQIK